LSEAQLANLKKGREAGLATARAKKLEREKQKKEDEEILLKAKEEIKKVDIEPLSEEVKEPITKQPEPDLITYDDDDEEEIEKPILKTLFHQLFRTTNHHQRLYLHHVGVEASDDKIKQLIFLYPDFVPPLDSFLSGFCMCIVGPSGSGKTNYLQCIQLKNHHLPI
jgi:flagellar biosynthesis GTPase FlhF